MDSHYLTPMSGALNITCSFSPEPQRPLSTSFRTLPQAETDAKIGMSAFAPIADIGMTVPVWQRWPQCCQREDALQIAVSGKFSSDHFDTGFNTSAKIRELLQDPEIRAIDTALDVFVFFPVIFSFEFEKKSHRSYSRKENAEFVNEEIDVAQWAAADEHGRLSLMIDALERAVRGTRSSRLHDDAKEAIVGHMRRAVQADVR